MSVADPTLGFFEVSLMVDACFNDKKPRIVYVNLSSAYSPFGNLRRSKFIIQEIFVR